MTRKSFKLAAAAEGALILEISVSRFHQLTRDPGFPAPHEYLSCGAIWWADDIRKYAEKNRRRPARSER
jgi:hypothetical protein